MPLSTELSAARFTMWAAISAEPHNLSLWLRSIKTTACTPILMLPTTASASDRDTHIGFFWGNSSSEDNMWHSFGSNNHISTITPKTSPSYYVVIKYAPSEYTLTLNKTSSNPSLTNNNSNYSLSGAVYEVYGNKTTYTTSTVTYYTVNASVALICVALPIQAVLC